MKRLICLFLSVVFLFGCGCANGGKNGEEAQKKSLKTEKLKLLYCYGDGFNPYTAKTELNRKVCSLVFDPLLNVTNEFEAEYCLASSVQTNANVCTVTLRDAVFSDGSPVTAADVVFSFDMAKNSQTGEYPFILSEISSASAIDAKTVNFTLIKNDPYAQNLLTFPILKSGTTGVTDSDGMAIPPIGSGRFVFGQDFETLVPNKSRFEAVKNITEIKLINSPDQSSVEHYVEVGAVDLYYTDVSDNIVRMSGKRAEVNINRFVYIGVNAYSGELSRREMRYAISCAVDREETVSGAFYSNAYVAKGFFNPKFADTKTNGTLKKNADAQLTVENLAKLGYNIRNDNGFYENAQGKHPVFSLLVNDNNLSRVRAAQLIAAQCRLAGIEVNVEKRPYDQYVSLISNGQFQLYLGETQILANMDFTGLCSPGGSAAYGVGDSSDTQMPVSSAISAYYSSQISATELAGVLLTEMPQIPVCYRKGLLFYNSKIKSKVTASVNDVFYSTQNFRF